MSTPTPAEQGEQAARQNASLNWFQAEIFATETEDGLIGEAAFVSPRQILFASQDGKREYYHPTKVWWIANHSLATEHPDCIDYTAEDSNTVVESEVDEPTELDWRYSWFDVYLVDEYGDETPAQGRYITPLLIQTRQIVNDQWEYINYDRRYVKDASGHILIPLIGFDEDACRQAQAVDRLKSKRDLTFAQRVVMAGEAAAADALQESIDLSVLAEADLTDDPMLSSMGEMHIVVRTPDGDVIIDKASNHDEYPDGTYFVAVWRDEISWTMEPKGQNEVYLTTVNPPDSQPDLITVDRWPERSGALEAIRAWVYEIRKSDAARIIRDTLTEGQYYEVDAHELHGFMRRHGTHRSITLPDEFTGQLTTVDNAYARFSTNTHQIVLHTIILAENLIHGLANVKHIPIPLEVKIEDLVNEQVEDFKAKLAYLIRETIDAHQAQTADQ
jgi:hypothetical protein